MAKPKGRNQDLFDATHEALLRAARALFIENGFDAVTTQMIAAKAKVSQGTIFHHFKTKRDLFIAVYNPFQLEFLAQIETAAAQAHSLEDRFDRIWRAYLASTDDEGLRRMVLLDGPRVIGLENVRAHDRETVFAFFTKEMVSLKEAGVIATASPHATAVLFIGALDQAAFEIADFPEDLELRQQLIDAFASLVERLKTDPAAP